MGAANRSPNITGLRSTAEIGCVGTTVNAMTGSRSGSIGTVTHDCHLTTCALYQQPRSVNDSTRRTPRESVREITVENACESFEYREVDGKVLLDDRAGASSFVIRASSEVRSPHLWVTSRRHLASIPAHHAAAFKNIFFDCPLPRFQTQRTLRNLSYVLEVGYEIASFARWLVGSQNLGQLYLQTGESNVANRRLDKPTRFTYP